ncbi:hypothetical protein P9E05_02275 [Bacillus mojavensis]|uniref:hypothetical protein n=1 Tax=Bacillus mojavensis TaxID=72360 RepID=UPI002DB9371D|nr:hypothetical protein [Bacillus mojavensis]MEC1690353.1 hypothetical protein [Bacillus mojavensis]
MIRPLHMYLGNEYIGPVTPLEPKMDSFEDKSRGPRVFVLRNKDGTITDGWYKDEIKSIEEEDGETVIRFYCGSWVSVDMSAEELKALVNGGERI